VQRSFRNKGALSDERVARLDALPGWVWSTSEHRWDKGYSALKRFVSREGHARVPYTHTEDGYRLGTWVVTQRQKRDRLPSGRIERLEALPGWTWSVKGRRKAVSADVSVTRDSPGSDLV
jgi:hypothetical protein